MKCSRLHSTTNLLFVLQTVPQQLHACTFQNTNVVEGAITLGVLVEFRRGSVSIDKSGPQSTADYVSMMDEGDEPHHLTSSIREGHGYR